jgi:Berberine and berberine like
VPAFPTSAPESPGQPAYPGVAGHEPNTSNAQSKAAAENASMDEIRKLLPRVGSYVWDTDFFQPNWQDSFWGENYARLCAVKDKCDSDGLFFLHHGAGNERLERGWVYAASLALAPRSQSRSPQRSVRGTRVSATTVR